MSYSNVIRCAAGLLGALMAAQTIAATPADELLCRDQPRPGSRIVTRACATEAQWVIMDKRASALRRISGSVEYPWNAGTVNIGTAVSSPGNRS